MKDIEELTNAALYSKNLKRKLNDSDSDGEGKHKEQEEKTVKKVKREVRKEGVYQ